MHKIEWRTETNSHLYIITLFLQQVEMREFGAMLKNNICLYQSLYSLKRILSHD